MSPDSLTDLLKQEAKRLEFDLVGATPATPPEGFRRLRRWIEAGHAGEMHYLQDRLDAYQHPRHVLDGARSFSGSLRMVRALSVTFSPTVPSPRVAATCSRPSW